jgi:Predicted archaeal kinase (sugar kinase superfamily)
MLEKLSETRKVEDFMSMSREFAETLGLTGGKCKGPLDSLKARGFESSVALFGETVFTLVPADMAQEAGEALRGFGGSMVVCKIDADGARVL